MPIPVQTINIRTLACVAILTWLWAVIFLGALNPDTGIWDRDFPFLARPRIPKFGPSPDRDRSGSEFEYPGKIPKNT